MDKMVNKYWKDIKAFLKLNSHKRPHFYGVFCKDYKLLLSPMVFPQKEASLSFFPDYPFIISIYYFPAEDSHLNFPFYSISDEGRVFSFTLQF